MPKMTSDLSNVAEMGPIPKGIYTIRVADCVFGHGKEEPHNPNVMLTHEIAEGSFSEGNPRQIKFDYIVLGGKNKEGKDIAPFRLVNFLEAARIPWECMTCHNGSSPRNFLRGSEENGLEKGKFFCPDCKSPMRVEYDTDTFKGAMLKGAVNIKKSDRDDREFNNIDKYLPL